MILFRKKRIPTTVLGLAFNGSRLEGALVKRSNGSLQVLKTFNATLALNPLTGDPELVGREIRNHLEQKYTLVGKTSETSRGDWLGAKRHVLAAGTPETPLSHQLVSKPSYDR